MNERLGFEFSNDVYDVVRDAIVATSLKYNYKKYDVAKLVTTIYKNDYSYLTGDNDYRVQFEDLDNYFKTHFNHRIITFEMVKMIKSFYDSDIYNTLVSDITRIEVFLRTGKRLRSGENDFSSLLEAGLFDELMMMIESTESVRYATAVVYDRILNKVYE